MQFEIKFIQSKIRHLAANCYYIFFFSMLLNLPKDMDDHGTQKTIPKNSSPQISCRICKFTFRTPL